MNKFQKFGIAAITMATVGIMTFTGVSYAQGPVGDGDTAGRPALAQRGGERGLMNTVITREEKKEMAASILNMSVADLEAAKEAGQSKSELVEAAGLTMEEFKAAMQTAMIAEVNQALFDGEITQEQADSLIERIENGRDGGRRGRGPGRGGAGNGPGVPAVDGANA
ncbi:MAG: hypothetical protein AAF639_40200 [Chloroflexota bacterium]